MAKRRYCFSFKLVIVIIVMSVELFSQTLFASADTSDSSTNSKTMTAVAKYALSWDGHSEMPYIFGGAGGRTGPFTLEECSEQGVGFDCSAFTMMVYRHFGIDIPTNSETQLAAAVAVYDSEEDAIPGDICYWYGHVGIYIGDGKLVHTNTPRAPYNYPHVNEVSYRGTPCKYLRMVEDIDDLEPLSGEEGSQAQEDVSNADTYGYIITESDLDGMDIPQTIIAQQQLLQQKDRSELSTMEVKLLEELNDSIYANTSFGDRVLRWFQIAQSFLGILCIFYAMVLCIAYLFDYNNPFFEFSVLSIVSLGHFVIADASADKRETISKLKARGLSNGKCYLTVGGLVFRMVLLIGLGVLLASHVLSGIIYNVVVFIRWYL